MEEFDENGWAPIHYAAYKKHVSLVQRLIETYGKENLELITEDRLKNTPLLLAATSGSQEMVHLLLNLGANIEWVNSQSHGVVEICAIHRHQDVLRYFLKLDNPTINVCRRLVTFLDSDSEDYVFSTCSVIHNLTTQPSDAIQSHINSLLAEGLVLGLIKVLKKNISEDANISVLNVLKSLLKNKSVKRQFIESDGVEVIVLLVFKGSRHLYSGLVETICELASEQSFGEKHLATIVGALLQLISNTDDDNKYNVLLLALRAMGLLATNSPVGKEAFGKQDGFISTLVGVFKDCQPKSLTIAWSEAVGTITERHPNNQNLFIKEKVGLLIGQMLKSKPKDVQMSAVKTLNRLVEGNVQAQKNIVDLGTVTPLMQLLKRSKSQTTQEAIAETLWALTGADTDTERTISARIGVNLLVEFVESASYKLNLIGSKGLSCLMKGPYDLRNQVTSANGVHHLVRLLRSHREDVVVSAIQALGHICLGVGFIPHYKNQTAVANSRGLKFLIALLSHSQSEYIQVEASLAIAATVLGHNRNVDLLLKNRGFHFGQIIHLLNSPNEEVHLMAGAALATFAFNNTRLQKEIVQSGGVSWSDFGQFLESANQSYQIHAAFQLVVLAKMIQNKEPSLSCALGIQMLVGMLESATTNETLALAADCVARLSHTRAGLSEAMVSIDVVKMLCQLLSSAADQVQGSAAIGLSYLSFNPMAERQLLKRCREDPHLMKVLLYYNKKHKWSTTFLERWKHIREVALPPIRSRELLRSSITGQTRRSSTMKHNLGCQFADLPSQALLTNSDQSQTTSTNHQLSL
ncbi:uncharacterized protein O3C94_022137 [Discoglossus pictus]